jgi:hypothetical protein
MAKSIAALGATTALMVAGLAFVAASPASAATLGAATTAASLTTTALGTTATLNGTVTADGTNAIPTINFCYSTTSSDVTTCAGGTTASGSPATATATASGQAESAAITGLTPGTTYYFNIKVTDASPATTHGTVLSFTPLQKASSAVAVSSVSPVSPASYGTVVTMTATVTAGATGYVEFESSLNGTTYTVVTGCSTVAISSSIATCATNTVPGGTVDLEALYSGDSNYFASTSAAYPYIVKNTSTVTVTVSPVSPTYYGNTATITAAVASGATGSVEFETSPNGSAWTPIVACTSVALSITTHTAVCTTNALPTGTAYLEAVYSGDANYMTSTSAAFPYVITQAAQGVLTLTVTPLSGTVGKAVTLSTTGGSSTGAVTYSVTNGTARGCTVSGTSLKVASAGTCIVTATKAADTNFSAVSSAAVTVSFIQPYQVYRVYGVALTGRTVNVAMTGVGFFGRPTIRSSAPGTSTLVLKDHGNWMLVRVTVSRSTARGVHSFTVILPNGKAARVNYTQR